MRSAIVVLLVIVVSITACTAVDQTPEETNLKLTFDGESCVYEGPAEIKAGPVTLLFVNNSGEKGAMNIVRHTRDKTIQDMLDYMGEEPSGKHHPSWTVELGAYELVPPGESHTWEGDLVPAIHTLVCANVAPIRVWFGAGLTVVD